MEQWSGETLIALGLEWCMDTGEAEPPADECAGEATL
jgi:hypothetical protein